MKQMSPRGHAAQRAVAAGACGVTLLAATVLGGAVHERDALTPAAEALLQATIAAQQVTTCIQGVRDELYVPGVPPLLHDPTAVVAAANRLRSCDTRPLSAALADIHLAPAAPLTTSVRRQARADVAKASAELARVVLDAHGAVNGMQRALAAHQPDGTDVILAFSSANTGTTDAYALAEEALELLGHPQSSVG